MDKSERLIRKNDPTNRYRKARKRAAYEIALIAVQHQGPALFKLPFMGEIVQRRIARGIYILFGTHYRLFTPKDAEQVTAKAIRVERGRRKDKEVKKCR